MISCARFTTAPSISSPGDTWLERGAHAAKAIFVGILLGHFASQCLHRHAKSQQVVGSGRQPFAHLGIEGLGVVDLGELLMIVEEPFSAALLMARLFGGGAVFRRRRLFFETKRFPAHFRILRWGSRIFGRNFIVNA